MQKFVALTFNFDKFTKIGEGFSEEHLTLQSPPGGFGKYKFVEIYSVTKFL